MSVMAESTMPASAGDLLGDSGAPLVITHNGKSYPVSPPTLRVLDRVEKLVAMRANEAVNELADVLPPQDFAELKADLMAKLRTKQHATGGALWSAEMQADGGMRGLQLVLFACLEEAKSPSIPFDEIPDVLANSKEAEAVAALLLTDFFRAAGQRKRIPPATVEAALQKTQAKQ